MTSIVNESPLLRSSREFPANPEELLRELDRSYIEIANAVNNRTIGVYAQNKPSATGNSWFINRNQRIQTLRRMYTFTAAGSIAHGIRENSGFVQIYGTFTDGSIWYPLPYVDATNATNQISVHVTTSDIVITLGAGTPPTITKGYVILEWLTFSPSMI